MTITGDFVSFFTVSLFDSVESNAARLILSARDKNVIAHAGTLVLRALRVIRIPLR